MSQTSNIDFNQIFLSDPLYSEYELSDWSFDEIISILSFTERSYIANKVKTLDSYCPFCERETTFISKESDSQELINATFSAGYVSNGNGTIEKLLTELQKIGTFQRTFYCPRPESNEAHDFVVLFKIIGTKLIKIGQSPSIAALSLSEIKKYRILKDNIYSELNRAIGLSSHGIGVGAFVYLRRIVEKHLLYPALESKISSGALMKEDITNIDIKTKIDLASDSLPNFLVENKKIYSILSKGIHELEETECKEHFQILRTAIEIILDEEIEKIEKEKKKKLIEKELNKIK